MRYTGLALALGLITALCVCVLVVRHDGPRETPTSVVIVEEDVHSRHGIGQTNAISVVDPATIAKLAALFPDYDKRASSDIAGGWEAGHRVYFNFRKGRAIRVTVSANGGGDTWSVGNGDFRTNGKFAELVSGLRRRAAR